MEAESTLSLWAQCDRIDTLFIVFCCAACWLVVPAIGLAFSGYSIRRNGLASYFPALLTIIFVSLQCEEPLSMLTERGGKDDG